MHQESPVKATPIRHAENLLFRTSHAISRAKTLILSHQYHEGFWWYTLEANESIGAEFIMLLHYLGIEQAHGDTQKDLTVRILKTQREDGSWAIYHGAPGDLSTTLECYFALKLAGFDPESAPMSKARQFILKHGGITKSRVFTKIHLALFGIVPWEACPAMPVSFMLLPSWFPVNIYEFSSWARACIVPLLVVLEKKKTVTRDGVNLEELFVEGEKERDYSFKNDKGLLSWENFFIQTDRLLKFTNRLIPSNPLTHLALKKAENWITAHVEKTEDIYPALAYSIFALTALSHDLTHPAIQKCLQGLLSFQQHGQEALPELPSPAHPPFGHRPPAAFEVTPSHKKYLHQQCCISPVWDTPWALTALLESGVESDHPPLLKAGRWLITKQITQIYGDWSIKNKKALPGGWSFEFENEFFPDVDDAIQVLSVLFRLDLPREEMAGPFQRGLDWIFSMQSKNGGWAAFDVDNTLEFVNKIPFSDHGACLDSPTPDITGRILELLGNIGYSDDHPVCEKALRFIAARQQSNGSWEGRWGVNYLYGTWCVVQGLVAIGLDPQDESIRRAVEWLRSVQNHDGGWSESCESYLKRRHVPLKESTASQTAWALMALIAAGEHESKEVRRGIEFLLSSQNSKGGWDEEAYTGTGFPGHFYIRYHGYRHYFPLFALAKYKNSFKKE
jgi:squalene-hopene/tetraprenyl-beta-curcumene cyclase